jgi:hypothetical protein
VEARFCFVISDRGVIRPRMNNTGTRPRHLLTKSVAP